MLSAVRPHISRSVRRTEAALVDRDLLILVLQCFAEIELQDFRLGEQLLATLTERGRSRGQRGTGLGRETLGDRTDGCFELSARISIAAKNGDAKRAQHF